MAYASRSMSKTEQKYAQIEKKALGITWACERFIDYLTDGEFKVETYHKPLVALLSTKDLSELPPRSQRFMHYSFSICHIPGKELITADALSRAPVDPPDPDGANVNAFVDAIISGVSASPSKLD